MPLPNNRIVLANAGSRKTTSLVDAAIVDASRRVLVVTYTDANMESIRRRFVERIGAVPPHVTLMSWYAFLLRHGVRPYQRALGIRGRIGTIIYEDPPKYAKKTDVRPYYLTQSGDIWGDRVSDFVCSVDSVSGGKVLGRLSKIFDALYVDEFQDLHGYDLDVLELLFASSILVVAFGDPRQAIIETNRAQRNRQYGGSAIVNWAKVMERRGFVHIEERTDCYRCNQAICDFADSLFPALAPARSRDVPVTAHDGIFRVSRAQVKEYVTTWKPVVLRHNKRAKTMGLGGINFGVAKGRTFDRTLIFTTQPMRDFLASANLSDIKDPCRFYVAVTRSRHSVAFVID